MLRMTNKVATYYNIFFLAQIYRFMWNSDNILTLIYSTIYALSMIKSASFDMIMEVLLYGIWNI